MSESRRLSLLKLDPQEQDEAVELEFELACQRTVTTQERFELRFRKLRAC